MSVLQVNGQKYEFSDGIPDSLAELLDHLNITRSTVVAELDGEIVQPDAFAVTVLKPGQSIELIRFVGGG